MGSNKLISIDMMSNLFKMDVDHLYNYLQKVLESKYSSVKTGGTNSSRYIYAKGNQPYMLVAHLDTVHKETCREIKFDFLKTKEGAAYTVMSSPQGIGGDDRCGVILILSLLLNSGLRPSILFTCGEETGGHGAREFCKDFKSLDLNFIIEFDRRGKKDVVAYSDTNMKLTQSLERYGFKRAVGSFSDISIIAPHFGVSAVNLSSAYYRAHTTGELVVLEELEWVFNHTFKFLTSKYATQKYNYIERVYTYTPQKYKSFKRVPPSYKKEDVSSRDNTHREYSYSFGYQSNIFDYQLPDDYIRCDLCQQADEYHRMIETADGSVLCVDCAEQFIRHGDYVLCHSCQCLTLPDDRCELCGADLKGGE